MDSILRKLAEYTLGFQLKDVPSETLKELIRHNLDGVGCAAGALNAGPSRVARTVARGVSGPLMASVYGETDLVHVPSATFANVGMNRYLDFNDAGGPGSLGHPNDMSPGIVALGEAMGASGLAVLEAMHVAYEVNVAICRGPAIRDRGWDQGLQCAAGAAAGLSRLQGLGLAETAHAISLAVTPVIPLRVTRTGDISHWKGFATAQAVQHAVNVVQLAQEGMTGPAEPFEGACGLFEQVTGSFEVDFSTPVPTAIARSSLKYVPAEANTQTAIEIMLSLRERLSLDDVERVEIQTYYLSWHETGGGQGDRAEKWDPKTREAADHSLPYVVAVALVDGRIDLGSFAQERVQDPALRPLMRRIEVVEDPELSARAADLGQRPMRMRVTLRDGTVIEESRNFARGNANNPMSDQEVLDKFDGMVERVLEPRDRESLKDALWHLNDLDEIGEATMWFRKFASEPAR